MTEPSDDDILDGLALWDEHKPQDGADWIAVAERFNAANGDRSLSSPLFAALSMAVEQRDEGRAVGRDEALREVVAYVREAANGYANLFTSPLAAADAIEAAFPTTGD